MAYDSLATTVPDTKTGVSRHEGMTITRTPDGSITVDSSTPLRARIPKSGDFDENLAEVMESSERRLLAMRLMEFCAVDEESRADWEARETTAMAMLGLKDKPKTEGGDDEQLGGHETTHPMLMEATTRFQSNAIVELFPPQGPAETKVLGTQTPPKMARAKRLRTFVNHYLTDVDEGYFNDTDKMTMYLPMGGSAFRRASQDFTTGLPILRHVKATNFIAPYAGTDLPSMPRYAWKFTMTGEDIDKSMQIGMFLDIYLPQPSIGEAEHAKASDISDQRSPTLHDRDRLYKMLEYHVDLELDCDPLGLGARKPKEGDIGRRPYLVIVDASNSEVLMVRRNWRKKDKDFKKRIWFAHHQFLPGLGFYGWGYPHVIGSLGMAASGAVNGLLDAALAANFQGGFVSKEAKIAGEFRLEWGVWQQVDSSGEDLAKSFFTPPFKEPSPALFQLLGALVDAGQRFCGTTDAAVGDGNNTGPVGTTIALIDQAQKPINAIHKRLHVSMSQELQMLCELIEDFMPDRYDYQIGEDQQFLLKSDFAPGVDVICVTDPAVSSDTQRVMRAQAVLELQEKAPDLYPPAHRAEAHRRMLIALKVPNLDAIGPVAKTPPYLDAVGENANIFAGVPVKVYPTQDDQAHIAIHTDGIQRASALYPPEVFQKVIQPAMQAHIRDHMAKAYLKQVMAAAGLPVRFDQDGNPEGMDPSTEQQVTSRVATIISRLPHPTPKPGTPSAEQQAAQQKLEFDAKGAQATLDQKEQQFQAEERRKQQAFDNEELRKDQALNNQEARIDITAATDKIRGGVEAFHELRQKEAEHIQDLVHGEREHEQGLAHGADEHQQGLDQSAQVHEQGLDQGQEQHEQGLEQGQEQHESSLEQGEQQNEAKIQAADKLAKAAASEEAEAYQHTGVK